MLDAADVLSTGISRSTTARVVGAVAFHGSVKPREIPGGIHKRVHGVRFRSCAGPPHCGQATCFQVG